MPIGGVLLVSDRTRRSGNGKLHNYIGHRTWTMDAKLPNLLGGMEWVPVRGWHVVVAVVVLLFDEPPPTAKPNLHTAYNRDIDFDEASQQHSKPRTNAEGSLWVSCDQASHIIVLKNVHGPSFSLSLKEGVRGWIFPGPILNIISELKIYAARTPFDGGVEQKSLHTLQRLMEISYQNSHQLWIIPILAKKDWGWK
ncbi:predicted protein [Histoplasma capsulatum H143]|uniref:Uncharacterized protein n=1 Tax=Ajellomyces capsulatus (strain H143) TaxID=544712 RepID=C6HMR4_AJECH|nr:predicted protein [Histoplasma capsulatum H143]